jgi:hypothetical protein
MDVRALTAVAALITTTGCASAPSQSFFRGRHVEMTTKTGRPEKGELLAVGPEQFLLLEDDRVKTVPVQEVDRVRVWRHDLNGSHVSTFARGGGLVTGGVLSLACMSVEDNGGGGCLGVGALVAATWAIVGSLATHSAERAARLDVSANWKTLEPYARFPQGLPEGLNLRGLEPSHPSEAEAQPSGQRR